MVGIRTAHALVPGSRSMAVSRLACASRLLAHLHKTPSSSPLNSGARLRLGTKDRVLSESILYALGAVSLILAVVAILLLLTM